MYVVADTMISIIVPALNEAGTIETTLRQLQGCRNRGHEVIVVDGGSTDATVQLARSLADRVSHSSPGRACQMQAGADLARGELLWFLHADTRIPGNVCHAIAAALASGKSQWGYFDVQFPERIRLLGLVAWMMNSRSRLTHIATGDQGIFVTRDLFRRVAGFRLIPLMEDIALSRSLKRHSQPACIGMKLTTSSRRWRRHGILRTILLMWSLRFAYFLGISPATLAKYYKPGAS
ncbi:MAG: TIGR04283 family arsenosugar biosynthesis glycosyltransferase [Gammaproteobacteria bacterium]|nr:TIGR04283 family arsenosugar biosynthesis glycosyltransferase [Gammaproteobacteria bacterium]